MQPAALRAILGDQIGAAAALLRKATVPSDASVHSARKALKAARASLRLLRDAIGRRRYARENRVLRDAARPLGQVRDAKIMLDVVDGMLRRARKAGLREPLLALRRTLRQERLDARARLFDGDGLKTLAAMLEKASGRIARWRISDEASESATDGLRRAYRKCRDALAIVGADRNNETLHDLRKQLKYLNEAMRILEQSGSRQLGRRIKRGEAVADQLGSDHDLAVLEQRVAQQENADSKIVQALFERRRTKLQHKALRDARLLLQKRPRVFIDGL